MRKLAKELAIGNTDNSAKNCDLFGIAHVPRSIVKLIFRMMKEGASVADEKRCWAFNIGADALNKVRCIMSINYPMIK